MHDVEPHLLSVKMDIHRSNGARVTPEGNLEETMVSTVTQQFWFGYRRSRYLIANGISWFQSERHGFWLAECEINLFPLILHSYISEKYTSYLINNFLYFTTKNVINIYLITDLGFITEKKFMSSFLFHVVGYNTYNHVLISHMLDIFYNLHLFNYDVIKQSVMR